MTSLRSSVLAICLIGVPFASAKTLVPNWVRTYHSQQSGFAVGYSAACDKSDSVIVGGGWESNTDAKAFVRKYDPGGNLEWAQEWGVENYTTIADVKTIVGDDQSVWALSLFDWASEGYFVAKHFSSDGTLLGTFQQTADPDSFPTLCMSGSPLSNGRIVVFWANHWGLVPRHLALLDGSGSVQWQLDDVDVPYLITPFGQDSFLAQQPVQHGIYQAFQTVLYSGLGTRLWSQEQGSTNSGGDLYQLGSTVIGDHVMMSAQQSGGSNQNMLVWTLDSQGNRVQIKSFSNPSTANGRITSDPPRGQFLVTNWKGVTSFSQISAGGLAGPLSLKTGYFYPSASVRDKFGNVWNSGSASTALGAIKTVVYVVGPTLKMVASGEYGQDGTFDPIGLSAATDSKGRVYLAGHHATEGKMFVLQYPAQSDLGSGNGN